MLIYEKDNKLNINFDNEVSEQPDLQISKEVGKTEVLIDGQPGGGTGGGGGVLPISTTFIGETQLRLNKTWNEISSVIADNKICIITHTFEEEGYTSAELLTILVAQYNNAKYCVYATHLNPDPENPMLDIVTFKADTADDYPVYSKD